MVREEFAGADASERKAAGDKRSHDFLMQALAAERPQDAVLSEEGADDPVRLRSERVWIVDPLDGTLVEMGSAGAKVASIVQGLSDVYVHAGGQFEWDSAAPVAVARGAGLHTSRIDGSALLYNRADPKLPDVVVCRPELAEAVLAVTG
ncbi:hypothetical protein MSTO_61010 [Mycobacterium stomatepiae]|uniref:3'(2'),5'-bisphosphate nucleotidase CysQ n=1 Tax=Mycobacterium stomatepiae TaxID=470076 RepID=A0A7I7QJ16_9MYCO|nr:hypothetical protein MSTO_61010 [Mycobacterium stomatepiae]